MQRSPLEQERESIGRESPANAIAIDLHNRLAAAARVEVRLRVISIEHADDDPIEAADLGHVASVDRDRPGTGIIPTRSQPISRAHERVQRFGCPIGTVRPFDRLRAQTDASELVRLAQRLEHGTDEPVGEIQLARDTIAELEPEHMVAEMPHRGDANELERGSWRRHTAERTLGEPGESSAGGKAVIDVDHFDRQLRERDR